MGSLSLERLSSNGLIDDDLGWGGFYFLILLYYFPGVLYAWRFSLEFDALHTITTV